MTLLHFGLQISRYALFIESFGGPSVLQRHDVLDGFVENSRRKSGVFFPAVHRCPSGRGAVSDHLVRMSHVRMSHVRTERLQDGDGPFSRKLGSRSRRRFAGRICSYLSRGSELIFCPFTERLQQVAETNAQRGIRSLANGRAAVRGFCQGGEGLRHLRCARF